MRFLLLDRIEELVPGERIVAVKNLSLAEEYLLEHFPLSPVMPGVLMLEAMTQAAAWLIRVTNNFSHSLVLLKEANSVKYGKFVEPGQTLKLEVRLVSQEPPRSVVRAGGSVDGRTAVTARLTLESMNLADVDPGLSELDRRLLSQLRDWFSLLWPARQIRLKAS
jgi:3-hydroxyacyl-[acyl-carrier-protein] dehydratase